MIFKNKKIAGLAAIAAVALPAVAYSATSDVEVAAEFRTAINLVVVDMDFGILEFSAATVGTSTATMDGAGAIVYANNFTGPATGTPGAVTISGSGADVIEIRCDDTATLEDGSADTIDLNTITVRIEGTVVDNACAGVGAVAPVTTHTVTGAGDDELFFGGILDGATASNAGAFDAGVYSTTTGTGTAFQVAVTYQ